MSVGCDKVNGLLSHTREHRPRAESLKDTIARTLPYWEKAIAPQLRAGKRVIVAAHGNSLRGLMKHLDRISDKDIIDLELPTGVPVHYELNDDLSPARPRRLIGKS